METKTVRVLPADVYDALEFSALVFGGIGRDVVSETPASCGWLTSTSSELRLGVAEPCCIHGHALFLSGVGEADIPRTLFNLGIDGPENDSIFEAGEKRIPFETWCSRLNVVRGDL